jgi:glycerol-3-phosphate acyltransferase PlsY
MTQIQHIPFVFQALITGVLSYVIGCFCTGYYFIRFKTGKDMRELGSGTVGARNAGRELGKTGFIVTFAGDLLKGSIAVSAARFVTGSEWLTALSLVAVILGHLFPIQLGFKGGKGLSTLTGGVLVLNAALVIILALCLVLAGLATKMQKLCGVIVIAVLPFAAIYAIRDPVLVTGVAVASAVVLLAHRKDILAIVKQFAGERKTAEAP